jgi:hypothetical protein
VSNVVDKCAQVADVFRRNALPCSHWQQRRMVLTNKLLIFGRLNSSDVIDVVPLKEIVVVKDVTKGLNVDVDMDFVDNQNRETSTRVVLQIETIPEGYNSGRIYRIRFKTPRDFDATIILITRLAATARERAEAKTRFRKSQDSVNRIFSSNLLQRFLAILIAAVTYSSPA